MTTQTLNASVADEQPESHSDLEPKPGANESNQIWEPGVWIRLPWLGLGSLLIILLCWFLLRPSLGAKNDVET